MSVFFLGNILVRTHRINKGTEVEEHSIQSDDAGGLEGIAVDDVAARHGVSNLDSRGDCEELIS
jgi:hypothetical protein